MQHPGTVRTMPVRSAVNVIETAEPISSGPDMEIPRLLRTTLAAPSAPIKNRDSRR